MKKFYSILPALIALIFLSVSTLPLKAQLSGTYTVGAAPGSDFATVKLAVDAINAQGISGPTVILMDTSTEVNSNIVLQTTTTNATNTLTFQSQIPGTYHTIVAGTGTGVMDGVLTINGTDYVNVSDLIIYDNPSNTTLPAMAEWGIALLKPNGTNGTQHCVIKNCQISLNRINYNAVGITIRNNTPLSTTQLTVTSLDGTNSFNLIDSCKISNCSFGIFAYGYNQLSAPYNFYDQSNIYGGDAGNIISDFGFSGYNTSAVCVRYQNDILIQNNIIAGGDSTIHEVNGIHLRQSYDVNAQIINNTITVRKVYSDSSVSGIKTEIDKSAAQCVVCITGNKIVNSYASTPLIRAFYGIRNGALVGPDSLIIIGNEISDNTYTGYMPFYGIYSGKYTFAEISDNQILDNITTGNMNSFYGIHCGYNSFVASNNVISGASYTSLYEDGHIYGIYSGNNFGNANITGNIINNLTNSGIGSVYGIYALEPSESGYLTLTISDNVISDLTALNPHSTALCGIYAGSSSTVISNNRIFNLFSSLNVGVYAIFTGGSDLTVSNCFISELHGSQVGICLLTSDAKILNNTVYLDYSSTNYFTSCCIFDLSNRAVNPGPLFVLQNNIFVNNCNSTANGNRSAFAIRGRYISVLSPESNNNLYYVNQVMAYHATFIIYNDYSGPDYYNSLNDYQTFVYPRESNSVWELPHFINDSVSPYDLHIVDSIPTLAERTGIENGLVNDYDHEIRNIHYPDLGADEFDGIIVFDSVCPVITYSQLATTFVSSTRNLDNVVIYDASGVNVTTAKPRVYFKRTSDQNAWTDNTNMSNGWKYCESTGISSPFSFVMDYSKLYGGTGVAEGDSIEYFVVAQDTATVPNVCINSAVTASPIASVNLNSSHFPVSGPINIYKILPTICGNYSIGQTGDFQNLTEVANILDQKVITCPIIFEILEDYDPSTETFPIVFNSNSGSSYTNTVTIRPAPGADIEIFGSSISSILKINGASNIIIDGSNNGTDSRNLTIENQSTSANQAAIWIASEGAGAGSNHITIKNCGIKTGTTTTASFAIFAGGSAISASGTGADISFLTIENNKICKAQFGIFCSGTTTSFCRNLFVRNNEIGCDSATEFISAKGILVANIDSATISGNNIHDVHGILSAPAYGIELGRHSNVAIEKNIIQKIIYAGSDYYGAQGIYVNSPVNTKLVIANNIIKGLKGNGAFSLSNTTWGIYLYYLDSCSIHFNTISISDEMPYYYDADRIGCIQISSFASGVNISNNIFCITGKPGNLFLGKITGILNHASIASVPVLDYNAYFLSSPYGEVAMQGPYPYTSYSSLQSWQNASGKDAHSIFANPDFVNPENLHPTSILLNNKGSFLIDYPLDFDGNARNVSTPDIGAYEFSPLSNNLALVNLAIPYSAGCKTNHETVTATIVNKGLNPIDFSTNPLSVSVSANGPLVQSFAHVVSSGTLLSLDSLVIIVADSFNAIIPGTYSLLSSIHCGIDQNLYDDSLYIPYEFISINPTVSISASDTLILSGQNSQLFAQATTTGCLNSTTSYYSYNTVSIPDQTTVYDSIIVTDSLIEASFLDQIVIDSLLHTWDDDLSIYICTPSGDTVLLTSNNGDDGDNFISTVFSQNATNSITTGVAPFTGMFLTENTSIANLSGSGAGSWKLIINDRANGDTGTLLKWHLVFKSPNIIADYDWTPAATISDPTVSDPICSPNSNTWYTVTVIDSLGCLASDSILITVIMVPSPVYPGDINNDALVDGNDLLLLGLNYNVAGSPRDSVSIAWLPQTSADWGMNMSGATLDLKFADCNGDGITLYNDTMAISQNFGLTHTFKTGITPDFPKATPTVSLLFPDTIMINTPTQIEVVLGDAANPFTNLHGIDFDFNLNTNVHITSFSLTSLLAAPSAQLKLLKNTGTNEYSLAFTKTDGSGFNGYGSAATLTMVFDSVAGLPFNGSATVSNAVCLNADGTWISPTGSASSFILASGTTVQINEPESNLNINIHPNPASAQTEISFTLPAPGKCVLTLRNTLGELIETTTLDGQSGKNSVNIDLSNLGQGIYVYTLEYKDVVLTRRLSVIK